MRKANLFVDTQYLAALNSATDASEALKKMYEAYQEAIEHGDKIYIPRDFWDFHGSWGDSFVSTMLDFELAQLVLKWLDWDTWGLLTTLIRRCTSATPNCINEWQEFEQEFPLENNGLLCCQAMETPPFVWDKWSWHELYCAYHTKYPQYITWLENDVFPNTNYSNFCIVEYVDKTTPSMVNKSDMEKINDFNTNFVRTFRNNKGELLTLATEIARRNCYIEDEGLTASEKERRHVRMAAIFKINKDGRYQYLSLDTENGQFEFCNHRGDHLGVRNFIGLDTAKGKSKADHGIKLK